jgi:ABC-type nitrate/sulfonate/bicarbonate transport system substrate-binding protein
MRLFYGAFQHQARGSFFRANSPRNNTQKRGFSLKFLSVRRRLAALSFVLAIKSASASWFVALCLPGLAYQPSYAADRSGSSDSIQIDKPAKKIERIRLGYSGPSMGNIPLLMAAKKGFLADEGFQIEFIQARSNVSIAAVITGDMQFTSATVSSAGAAARGVPIKVIGVIVSRPYQYFIVKPNITSVEQLKGKIFAVDSLGGTTTYLLAKEMMRQAGVDAEKDVRIIAIGDAFARIAQMKAGTVDGTSMTPPQLVVARNQGFRILGSVKNVPELPSTGLAASEKSLRENPEQVKRMLRATVRSLIYVRENREETIRLVMEHLKLDRPIAEESYDLVKDAYSTDGSMSDQGFRLVSELQRETNSAKANPASQMSDFSLLRQIQGQLKAEGILK